MGLKKPSGVSLPTLTKPATDQEIFYGYEAIDQNGGTITGQIPLVTASTSAGTPSLSGTNLLMKSAAQDNGLHISKGGTVSLITALNNLGNASVYHVLSGKTITSSAGVKVAGTMANNGAVSKSLNGGESYTIPAGYHDGNGKVTGNLVSPSTVVSTSVSITSSSQYFEITRDLPAGNYICCAENGNYYATVILNVKADLSVTITDVHSYLLSVSASGRVINLKAANSSSSSRSYATTIRKVG